jgi:hypothetical protein
MIPSQKSQFDYCPARERFLIVLHSRCYRPEEANQTESGPTTYRQRPDPASLNRGAGNFMWFARNRKKPPVAAPIGSVKRVVFRAITLIPLLTIIAVGLWFLCFTNLPQLFYNQSIRNINFDCQVFSTAYYVYKMKPGKCTNENIEWSVVY